MCCSVSEPVCRPQFEVLRCLQTMWSGGHGGDLCVGYCARCVNQCADLSLSCCVAYRPCGALAMVVTFALAIGFDHGGGLCVVLSIDQRANPRVSSCGAYMGGLCANRSVDLPLARRPTPKGCAKMYSKERHIVVPVVYEYHIISSIPFIGGNTAKSLTGVCENNAHRRKRRCAQPPFPQIQCCREAWAS